MGDLQCFFCQNPGVTIPEGSQRPEFSELSLFSRRRPEPSIDREYHRVSGSPIAPGCPRLLGAPGEHCGDRKLARGRCTHAPSVTDRLAGVKIPRSRCPIRAWNFCQGTPWQAYDRDVAPPPTPILSVLRVILGCPMQVIARRLEERISL